MNSLASELCLISACSRLNWIYCYFIYLFFKTFKVRIFKVKFVFPYFEGIFVQNTGNSYYLAGLYSACKLWTFKKIFTAPWLKNLVEYSYLLPKHCMKISREKKWAFSFYFTFCKKGHFTCKSMESGIIEGAITTILEHYKAHFDL